MIRLRGCGFLAGVLLLSACTSDPEPNDDDAGDEYDYFMRQKDAGSQAGDSSLVDRPLDAATDSGKVVATDDAGGLTGLAFPLTLTTLSNPQVETANISLFFSVTDKNGAGVTTLQDAVAKAASTGTAVNCENSDFVVRENGEKVDCAESDFRAGPLQGKNMKIPTVLVLDLSGSIVGNGQGKGDLTYIKEAATSIVDAMLPEQSMAIVTFADRPNVRGQFSSNKEQLKALVSGIDASDGAATNLYESVITAVEMWEDHFDPSTEILTAGLAIVLTDGADNAASRTLEQVKSRRGNKRVITVGVGSNIDKAALTAIQTAGFLNPSSYGELATSISNLTQTLQTLNRSIYKVNYCSPKRSGSSTHKLSFTVKGNEEVTTAPTCAPAIFGESATCGSGQLVCAQSGPNNTRCCKSETPYHCASTGMCYATAERAAEQCPSTCTACGGSGRAPTSLSSSKIEVSFNASNYDSKQCPAFRGPQCKALSTCCATLSDTLKTQCAGVVAQGVEAECGGQQEYYECAAQTLSPQPPLPPGGEGLRL